MNDQSAKLTEAVNPITAEIIRYHLLAIPKQIEVNITRTAYSPLVYEYKDYAVGIVDAEGRLISEGQGGIPLFVANALGVAVQDGLAIHGRDGLQWGDVVFSNHSGTLGQHLNNVVMYTPIRVGPNREHLVGFMAVLMHWIDIGGMMVGSAAPIGTTEIYAEGVQFRSVKLWSRGEPVKDMYRTIEVNTRFPRMLLGDLESQVGGCLLGRDQTIGLIEKYGLAEVQASIELMWLRSEATARAAIRAMPDGEYRASSVLDNDGYDLTRPVPIDVVVRVHGDEMTVDLSGVADQVRGNINSGREGGAVTAARIAFKYLATPHEPANDGAFRPLHVIIPDGKFLSARGDAPMAMYSLPLPTVIDTIMKAMTQAAPAQLAAGHHANFAVNVFDGYDPKTGERFYNLPGASGGWGASQGHDGAGPYKTMSHGDTLEVPVEVQEALYPIRVDSIGLRPDSGGAGEFRGGLGLEKLMTMLTPCNAQLNIERTTCPAWGVFDGHAAPAAAAYIERKDAAPELVLKGIVPVETGDRVRVITSGGGGYGDPRRRDPDSVARDVRLGYVTARAAQEDYGVALDQSGDVDAAKTRALRGR